MSLRPRWIALALVAASLALGCGGPQHDDKGEPQTAREKQLLEAKKNGDLDRKGAWKGWRYQGDRNDCFYVVGRRCFKTQKKACAAARCRKPKACKVVGGGPATVSCE